MDPTLNGNQVGNHSEREEGSPAPRAALSTGQLVPRHTAAPEAGTETVKGLRMQRREACLPTGCE